MDLSDSGWVGGPWRVTIIKKRLGVLHTSVRTPLLSTSRALHDPPKTRKTTTVGNMKCPIAPDEYQRRRGAQWTEIEPSVEEVQGRNV